MRNKLNYLHTKFTTALAKQQAQLLNNKISNTIDIFLSTLEHIIYAQKNPREYMYSEYNTLVKIWEDKKKINFNN